VPGDRWFVDETYVKVNGRWTYLYRAIDQYGQVIDVWLSTRRDLAAARTFLQRALSTGVVPVEVTTDRAPAYDELEREPLDPAVDRDVLYIDPTLGEQFLNIAVGQAVPQVPPHCHRDHLAGETESSERGGRGRRHRTSVSTEPMVQCNSAVWTTK